MRLLGQGYVPAEVPQGGGFDLSLYWQRGPADEADYEATLQLVGVQSRRLLRQPLVLSYPTSRWQVGERLRGQYHLVVPAVLPAGEYELRLSVAPAGTDQALRLPDGTTNLALGRLRVTGLAREMAPPAVGFRGDARYGGIASLYGFDLPGAVGGVVQAKPGQRITPALRWEALAPTDTSYTVFVHLADATGRPWGQQDAPPALGARPTTGWLTGEYIADQRLISVAEDVPAGSYRLLVGLYGPDGKRLEATTAAGVPLGNAVPLTGVSVEVQR